MISNRTFSGGQLRYATIGNIYVVEIFSLMLVIWRLELVCLQMELVCVRLPLARVRLERGLIPNRTPLNWKSETPLILHLIISFYYLYYKH